jgi:hypothetical protein
MVWKIDVLRGYIWHQRLHLLQDYWWWMGDEELAQL